MLYVDNVLATVYWCICFRIFCHVSVFLLPNFVVNLWVTPHVHASWRGVPSGGLSLRMFLPAYAATVRDHCHGPLPTTSDSLRVPPTCLSPACDPPAPRLRVSHFSCTLKRSQTSAVQIERSRTSTAVMQSYQLGELAERLRSIAKRF